MNARIANHVTPAADRCGETTLADVLARESTALDSNDLPPNPRPRHIWTTAYVHESYDRGILDGEDVEQFAADTLMEVSDVLPPDSRYWLDVERQGGKP